MKYFSTPFGQKTGVSRFPGVRCFLADSKNDLEKRAKKLKTLGQLSDLALQFATVERLEPLARQINNASLRLFWLGLAGLSETEFDAFMLRYRSGLSQTDIAVVIGVSQSGVSRALYRARRHLSPIFGRIVET